MPSCRWAPTWTFRWPPTARAGLFFGYASVCVPANLALQRFGVRRWLAFMFLAWGLASCLMAALQGVKSFYVLRFLLGVAEAASSPP